MTEDARKIWSEKLSFLEAEEAKLSDPNQRFAVARQIQEAKAKLAELDGRNDDRGPEWMLSIRRSSQRTDVSVIVLENELPKTQPLNRDRRELNAPFQVGSEEHPRRAMPHARDPLNKMALCTIRLENACRSGHGSADWRIVLEPTVCDGLKILQGALLLAERRGQSTSQGTLRDSPEESLRKQDLLLELDLSRVMFFIRDSRIALDVIVHWTVREDGPLDPQYVLSFQNRLRVLIHLRHEPPPDVLAIYFGTAAIAVAHARGPKDVFLLPLPEQLAVIEKMTGIPRLRYDPEQARNSYFLTSAFNVCLDDTRLATIEPDSPDFIDLPMAEMAIYGYPDKCYSSLLTLIADGFSVLPFDAGRHPYQYLGKLERNAFPLLHDVIKSAYRGLLRDFIEPLLAKTGRSGYSHVYITHPNIYTANNVRTLRNAVEEIFAGMSNGHNVVYRENIHFISESDAVAYYYLINAHRLRTQGNAVPKTERVLVYDIGADTLDLTYLEVDWISNESEGVSPGRIRVRRRGGVAKAGNLLDECIARDLHAYLERALDSRRYLTPIVVPNPGERMDQDTVRRMDELRQKIHRLKAQLSDGTEYPSLELSTFGTGEAKLVLTIGEDTPELYLGCTEIRATERGQVFWEPGRERLLTGEYVNAFVERVTRTEILNFFGNKVPRLDTVIVSGGTSLWPTLGASLRETLGNVPNWVDFGADAYALKVNVVMGVLEREFRWRNLAFEAMPVPGQLGVRFEHAHPNDWHIEPYDLSGEQHTFFFQNASEVQIGLRTTNGFHPIYSLLPDFYYGEDHKLTIKLEFDDAGYLEATINNSHGDNWLFTGIVSIPQSQYHRLPWPLGAAKLHAVSAQALLDRS